MAGEVLKTPVPSVPEAIARRGINEAQWRTLCNSLFPGADPKSVLMVVDYCAARKLDPMKKPCHIVPMRVKDARTGDYGWRDVILPGIYEYRTTAQRTGEYLGHSKPVYGPSTDVYGVAAPEWCEMTMYRWNTNAGREVPFPVQVFFREAVGLTKDKKTGAIEANDRWSKAPIQMLTKCTEAAGLREAFPDELGGEPTAEEMDGQRAADIVVSALEQPATPKPDGYDDWLEHLAGVAEQGTSALDAAWETSAATYREYLATTNRDGLDLLKAKAAAVKPGGEA